MTSSMISIWILNRWRKYLNIWKDSNIDVLRISSDDDDIDDVGYCNLQKRMK